MVFTILIRPAFSYLSAICPASDENRKKRQNENRARHHHQHAGIGPGTLGDVEGHKNDQREAENVIVERAEELRTE